MAVDALLVLRASSARTSSGGTTAVDFLTGGSRVTPLWGRFIYTVTSSTGSTGTAIFEIQHSDASGSGFVTCSSGAINTITLDGSTGIVWVPFLSNRRYVREFCTLTGTSPSITYKADISPTKDGA